MNRILGALMAFVFSSLSVIFLPLMLFWKFPVYFGFSLGVPAIFLFSGICVWGAVVGGMSLVIGFRAGVYETMDIFNVMWRTGESYDLHVHAQVVQIKKIIFFSALASGMLLFLK